MTFEVLTDLKKETELGAKSVYTLLIDSEENLPESFEKFLKHSQAKLKPKFIGCFEKEALSNAYLSLGYVFKTREKYSAFQWARKLVNRLPLKENYKIYFDLRSLKDDVYLWLSCLVNTLSAKQFELPNFKKEKKPKPQFQVFFIVSKDKKSEVEKSVQDETNLANANNFVRRLAILPSNELTPTSYRKIIEETAKENKLTLKFYDFSELKKMGAGAFTAVAQGSNDPNRGIYHLKYVPKNSNSNRKVCFVGKGITFDTGGHNLKTGQYMFGMHEDMTGSALALALVQLAAKNKWLYEVHSFLAITENLIGPESFRPNDVIRTLNGLSVEVIDTDAEGRLVLADTLALACKEKPDLLLDFATLTGSCIRALGTTYSGVFVNQSRLYSVARKASQASGERVWPFPNHKEYKKILKSQVADIKQCRLTGGPDHIEAFQFLNSFVEKKVPYLHIDLSAAHNEGGLAHIASKTTGFGVHFSVIATQLFFN